MWYVYTREYYSVIKKNEILPFAIMWMELECIMLSEISQRKTYVLTHVWNLRSLMEDHGGREGKGRGKNIYKLRGSQTIRDS